jgi:serine/threonine protein kinase
MPRVTKYDENDEPISGYRLVSFLGSGQFGEVWKAVESTTGKLVAIKIIDLSHSNSALKELKALNLVKNLNHPHLIPIFTARLKDKNNREIPLHQTEALKGKGVLRELVIAMGLGDKSLSARLKEINPDGTDPQDFKGLPIDELLGYLMGAAKGIDFLNKADHGLGANDGPIVHCDIKPDNMMIVAGEVQIVDCGVAVIITPDVRQTKAAGSPAYSAPELTGNKPVPGTDQYALAISYYELRTGKLPFDEQMGQLSIMLAHAEGRLDFTSPLISDEERQVLKWATSVRPKERYATCLDMVKQLERAIEGLPPQEPGKVQQLRSGVVPTSKSRVAPPPPLDPSMLRSTPNLPNPSVAQPYRPPADPAISFELPVKQDELRGTVIPGSDGLLPSSDSGLALPNRGGPAGFAGSHSDIVMPAGTDAFANDQEFGTTGTHPGLGGDPATRSTDPSRPQISVDGNDPMGARAGTVELDPEIQRIIAGSGALLPPAARSAPAPASPAVQTQRAPSRADATPATQPGQRSTQYPRETPAEEEAKSLPPWAKEAKVAEQKASRGSLPSLQPTNWKGEEPTKSGGKGTAFLIGGVFAAGLAGAAGLYFSGVIGGGAASSSASADPNPNPNPKPPGNDTKPPDQGATLPEPEKVNPELVKAIDELIKAKPNGKTVLDNSEKDYRSAQEKFNKLPETAAYKNERERLQKRLTEFRNEIDAEIGVRVGVIEKILKDLDVKGERDANEMKLNEAERLIAELPQVLPESFSSRRNAFRKEIGEKRIAMAGSDAERKFLAALDDLEKIPKAGFTVRLKEVYKYYDLSDQRKKLGVKLVTIGESKPEMRDAIIAFIAEDSGFFQSLFSVEAEKAALFKWRVAPIKTLAEDLRKKLASLTTGKTSRTTIDDINATIDRLKDRKKEAGVPFGTHWNDKYLDAEIDKTLNLATIWSEAISGRGQDIPRLRTYVQATVAPDLALPMALEYLRIGSEKSESIPNLRQARDASRNWTNLSAAERSLVDDLYQLALARQVRKDLAPSNGKPNWTEIVKLCDRDNALGWRALADAEGKIESGAQPGAIDTAASASKDDDTAADRAAFAAYLKAVAKSDKPAAGELLKLYQTPLPILVTPHRSVRTASVLAANSIIATTSNAKPEEILDGKWKPYASNPTSLAQLSKAYELDGRANRSWAIHLFFLAEASGDSAAARAAAKNVELDETKLTKPEEFPFALAYFVSQAGDAGAPRDARVAAYASASRLAYRMLESASPDDFKTRQEAFLPKYAEFAQRGLALDSGSNVDRSSLGYAVFLNDFLKPAKYDAAWIANAQQRIEPIARALPRSHPAFADAYAYKAFVALYRFSATGAWGSLKKDAATESDRSAAWKGMITDAETALSVEKDNPVAAQVLAYAYFGMFGLNTPYPPPEADKTKYDVYKDRDAVLKTAGYLKLATDSPRARATPAAFWRLRGNFLLSAVNGLAKTGGTTKEDLVKLLGEAATSAQKSYDLRADKPIEDMTLLGRILEDLAWFGQEKPAENYRNSIEKTKVGIASELKSAAQRLEAVRGHLDIARATIRAVRHGHFPAAKLADADAAWSAMTTAIDALSESERQAAFKYIASTKAEAAYWKAVRWLADGDPRKADAAFQAAEDGLRTHHSTTFFLHASALRAEAILAGNSTRADASEKILALSDNASAIASEYLKARNALANDDPATAKIHFDRAFKAIDVAKRNKELVVEEPFALRCLAYDLMKANRGDAARIRLLRELQSAYGWSLTTDDRKLVEDALGR